MSSEAIITFLIVLLLSSEGLVAFYLLTKLALMYAQTKFSEKYLDGKPLSLKTLLDLWRACPCCGLHPCAESSLPHTPGKIRIPKVTRVRRRPPNNKCACCGNILGASGWEHDGKVHCCLYCVDQSSGHFHSNPKKVRFYEPQPQEDSDYW